MPLTSPSPDTAPVALIDRLATHLSASPVPLPVTALAAVLGISDGYVRLLCRELARRGVLRRTATGTYGHHAHTSATTPPRRS